MVELTLSGQQESVDDDHETATMFLQLETFRNGQLKQLEHRPLTLYTASTSYMSVLEDCICQKIAKATLRVSCIPFCAV